MKAQGTLEPTRGHFSPLGQYTSEPAPCRLMLSREHGKQNLWCGMDGHWTKCVSSRRSWHRVHLSDVPGSTPSVLLIPGCAVVDSGSGFGAEPPPAPPPPLPLSLPLLDEGGGGGGGGPPPAEVDPTLDDEEAEVDDEQLDDDEWRLAEARLPPPLPMGGVGPLLGECWVLRDPPPGVGRTPPPSDDTTGPFREVPDDRLSVTDIRAAIGEQAGGGAGQPVASK